MYSTTLNLNFGMCLIEFLNILRKNDKVNIRFSNGMYYKGTAKRAKKLLPDQHKYKIVEIKETYKAHPFKIGLVNEFQVYVESR